MREKHTRETGVGGVVSTHQLACALDLHGTPCTFKGNFDKKLGFVIKYLYLSSFFFMGQQHNNLVLASLVLAFLVCQSPRSPILITKKHV